MKTQQKPISVITVPIYRGEVKTHAVSHVRFETSALVLLLKKAEVRRGKDGFSFEFRKKAIHNSAICVLIRISRCASIGAREKFTLFVSAMPGS